MSNLKNQLFALLKSMILENGEPKAIARGFAIGIFIGFLPIVGFQTLPAFFLASKFHANRIAAMIAVWITNPFTIVLIYLCNYWTGSLFFSHVDAQKRHEFREFLLNFNFNNFYDVGWKILAPFLLGSILNGILFAFISYRITFRMAPIVRAWVYRPNLMRYFKNLRKTIVGNSKKRNLLFSFFCSKDTTPKK